MKHFSTESHSASRTERRNPIRRALLGVAGLLVVGSLAAACGSSNGSPGKGNTPTTVAPAGGATTTTAGGGGGVGF
jgi:hypothetical protein